MEKKRFLEGDNKRFCVVSRLLCFFCLFIGIYACQVDEDGVVNKGTLAFRMNVDTALVGVSTKASDLVDFKDVNSYAVTIAQDSGVVAEYSRFDKMPAELELGAGAYTIQVSKGTETAAAFDAPYFSGKKEFTIVKDMTTPVEVTAAMANSRVTIDYSDDFLQTYKDYTLSLKTNKMELPLVYEKGESRPMYFQSDASGTKLEIAMELVNVYGKTVNYTATTTIKPKQWAKLTVRTDEKGLNGIAIDVTLNDETKETIYVNIGIPDFMEKLKGAPYISTEGTVVKWSDSNKDEDFEKTFSSYITVSKVPVSITAGGKIDKLILSVYEHEAVKFSYDLANLTVSQREELQEQYQLVLPESVKEAINVQFDLQGFLRSLFDKEDKNYVIELSAIDALPEPNKTTKRIIATYKAMAAPKINSGNPKIINAFEEGTYKKDESIGVSGAYLDLKSFTFGRKDEEQIDLILKDIENVTFTRVEATTPTMYTLQIKKEWFNNLPAGEHNFTMKLVDAFDREVTNTLTVTVTPPVFEWAMAENDGDIFAKYVYLRVKAKDADKVAFYQNRQQITNLVPLEQDENGVVSFVWTGLRGNTSYSGITAEYSDGRVLSEISFTTEEEKQLPNAGFEEWTKEFICNNTGKVTFLWYRGKDINRWTPASWQTNNEETTSGNPTPSFWLKAFPTVISAEEADDYCPYKTVSYSGKSAAVISTVGWGSDLTWISGTPTNTAGQLYVEDINWVSRPSYLQFGCQFTSYENEQFAVKVVLKNEQKEPVTDFEVELSNEDIKEGKVKIPFPVVYKKVSYISLMFLSSSSTSPGSDKVEGRNNDNGGGISEDRAKDGGHNDSRYIGNTLIIDDVELIYDYPNE